MCHLLEELLKFPIMSSMGSYKVVYIRTIMKWVSVFLRIMNLRVVTDTALEWFFERRLKRLQSTLRTHIFISLCIKLHTYNRRLIHLKSLVYYLSLSHSTVTN